MEGHTRTSSQSGHQEIQGSAKEGDFVVRSLRVRRDGLPGDGQEDHATLAVVAGARVAQADDPAFILGQDSRRIRSGAQGIRKGGEIEQRSQIGKLLIIEANGQTVADGIAMDAAGDRGADILGEVGHMQNIGAEGLLRGRQATQDLGGGREERSTTGHIRREPVSQTRRQRRQILGPPDHDTVSGEQGRGGDCVGFGEVPDFVVDPEEVEGLGPMFDPGEGEVQLLKGGFRGVQQKGLGRPGCGEEVVSSGVVVGAYVARAIGCHDEVAVNLVGHQFGQEELGRGSQGGVGHGEGRAVDRVDHGH